MMNDAFGNELKVGDEVYYIFKRYGNHAAVEKAKITGFTPKMVRVNVQVDGGRTFSEAVVNSYKLIKDRYADGHAHGWDDGFRKALEDRI